MTTENSFDPGNVTPATVELLADNNVNQEQSAKGTQVLENNQVLPGGEVHTEVQRPVNQELSNQPVQSQPQDSEVYKNLQAAFTRVSQDNSDLKNRIARFEMELSQKATIQEQSKPVDFTALDEVSQNFEELKPIAEHVKNLETKLTAQQSAINNRNEIDDALAAQQKHDALVRRVYPDSAQIADSVEFQSWLVLQPSYVQQVVENGNSQQVIDLLTSFKNSFNNQNPNQKQSIVDAARLAGAPDNSNSQSPIITTDNTKRIFTNEEIANMSFAEYARQEAEINQALAEGRVTV